MGWCNERLSIQGKKKKRFIFIYYFHFLSYGDLLWLYFLNIEVNFFFIDIVLPLIILVCTFRFLVSDSCFRWDATVKKCNLQDNSIKQNKQKVETKLWLFWKAKHRMSNESLIKYDMPIWISTYFIEAAFVSILIL